MDPGFQVSGGTLKIIVPSRANFWGITCEKSWFYAKKIIFFPIFFWGGGSPLPWIRPCIMLYEVNLEMQTVHKIQLTRFYNDSLYAFSINSRCIPIIILNASKNNNLQGTINNFYKNHKYYRKNIYLLFRHQTDTPAYCLLCNKYIKQFIILYKISLI